VYAATSGSNDNGYFAGYWKNGTWIDLAPVTQETFVNALVASGTDVYAGGSCTTIPGVRYDPGYWKNGTWNSLILPRANLSSQVISLAIVP
jgi:hypothetical protein